MTAGGRKQARIALRFVRPQRLQYLLHLPVEDRMAADECTADPRHSWLKLSCRPTRVSRHSPKRPFNVASQATRKSVPGTARSERPGRLAVYLESYLALDGKMRASSLM